MENFTMDGSGRHHLHLLSKLNAAKTTPIRGYVPPEGMPGDVATTTTSEIFLQEKGGGWGQTLTKPLDLTPI